MVSCQKVQKFDFESQFFVSKIIQTFLIFFIDEYDIKSTFFDSPPILKIRKFNLSAVDL